MNFKAALTLGYLAAMLSHTAVAAALDELPKDVAGAYQGLDTQQPVGESAYRDWKPKKGPPWIIGYASPYSGNTWSAAATDRLVNKLLPEYKKAGLVDKVIVTQADLKDSVQIQQMRQLVDQGADAIIICCSNVTSLNQTIKYAHDKGVPVFSYSGFVTSPYAVSSSANYTDGGYQIAKSLFDKIGKKGNVLLVSGIPGRTSSDSYDKGVNKALAEYPNVKLVGDVAGQWTSQIAQTEVQKFLATHPQKIDGIIVQSPAETGVLKALLQSGRPVVPITLSGELGSACYWRKHKDWSDAGYFLWPPGGEMDIALETAVRTLEGQGPKLQSIIRRVGKFTYQDVLAAVPENCDTDATGWMEPAPGTWFPPKLADSFFMRPQDPLKTAK